MSANDTTAENAIDTDAAPTPTATTTITGPHMEPPEVANATTYWRCEDCGRESIHKQDTQRPAFHAEGCAGREEGEAR